MTSLWEKLRWRWGGYPVTRSISEKAVGRGYPVTRSSSEKAVGRLPGYSVTHSFGYPVTHSFGYPVTHSFGYPVTHSFGYPVTRLLTLGYPVTHSRLPGYSLGYPVTHSRLLGYPVSVTRSLSWFHAREARQEKNNRFTSKICVLVPGYPLAREARKEKIAILPLKSVF